MVPAVDEDKKSAQAFCVLLAAHQVDFVRHVEPRVVQRRLCAAVLLQSICCCARGAKKFGRALICLRALRSRAHPSPRSGAKKAHRQQVQELRRLDVRQEGPPLRVVIHPFFCLGEAAAAAPRSPSASRAAAAAFVCGGPGGRGRPGPTPRVGRGSPWSERVGDAGLAAAPGPCWARGRGRGRRACVGEGEAQRHTAKLVSTCSRLLLSRLLHFAFALLGRRRPLPPVLVPLQPWRTPRVRLRRRRRRPRSERPPRAPRETQPPRGGLARRRRPARIPACLCLTSISLSR